MKYLTCCVLMLVMAIVGYSSDSPELDSFTLHDEISLKEAKSISIKRFPVVGKFKGKKKKDEYVSNFINMLVEGLQVDGGFESIIEVDDESNISTDLVIEGKFVKMSTGSRATRFWVGLGAGKSGCDVEMTCYRASDGKKVFDLQHERISLEGLKKDELEENLEEVASDIISYLLMLKKS